MEFYWPTESRPVPLSELGWINTTYLSSGKPWCDPFLVWGTTVETEPLDDFVNEFSRQSGVIVSPAHVLVGAVAASLRAHPEVNRRVIGKNVYSYRGANVVMPMKQGRSGEVDCVFLREADGMSLQDIARRFWNEARQKSQRVADEKRRENETRSLRKTASNVAKWLRLKWIHSMSKVGFFLGNRFRLPALWSWQMELYAAGAFVNYLGFPGAPPLRVHKPAALPMNSYSILVTMGPSEKQPVVVEDNIEIRKVASLFVRFDHRIVNGYQSGTFVKTLRSFLADPWTLTQRAPSPQSRAA